jgi:hypothetical protein
MFEAMLHVAMKTGERRIEDRAASLCVRRSSIAGQSENKLKGGN